MGRAGRPGCLGGGWWGGPGAHSSSHALPVVCASAEDLDQTREEKEKSPPEPHTPPSTPVKREEGELAGGGPEAAPRGRMHGCPGQPHWEEPSVPTGGEEQPSVAGAELALVASARLHGASASLALRAHASVLSALR